MTNFPDEPTTEDVEKVLDALPDLPPEMAARLCIELYVHEIDTADQDVVMSGVKKMVAAQKEFILDPKISEQFRFGGKLMVLFDHQCRSIANTIAAITTSTSARLSSNPELFRLALRDILIGVARDLIREQAQDGINRLDEEEQRNAEKE